MRSNLVIALFYYEFFFLYKYRFDVIVKKMIENKSKHNYSLPLALLVAIFLTKIAESAEETGEALFLKNCAECHQRDGKGISNIYPSLAGNEVVMGSGVDVALVLIIGRGEMPSFSNAMSSNEMAKVINYVRNAFGNKGELISIDIIDSLKQ